MSTTQTISAIGIGNMGAALSLALLKAGIKLTIWNRTADRPLAKSVVAAGATLETDIKSAVAKNDGILIFCVVDYDAMYKLLEPLRETSDGLAGKTIVNLTNGTPKQAIEMNQWIKARGAAHYFDGAVLVTPQMVATPAGLLVYSGETQQVFDGIKDALTPLGHPLYYGPDVDAAAAQDLALLAAMYGMFYGAFVGMGILKRAGKGQGNKVLPGTQQVTSPIIAALAAHLDKLAAVVDSEDWTINDGNPLEMQFVGLNNIIQAAEDVKVDGSGLKIMASAMGKAVEDGWGDGALSAAIKHLLL